jgi:hypothetical protein
MKEIQNFIENIYNYGGVLASVMLFLLDKTTLASQNNNGGCPLERSIIFKAESKTM